MADQSPLTSATASLGRAEIVLAALAGAAIPGLFFGRTAVAIVLLLALVALLVSARRGAAALIQRFWLHAATLTGVAMVMTLLAWMPGALMSSFPFRSFEAAARTLLFAGIALLIFSAICANVRMIELSAKAFVATTVAVTVLACIAITLLPELYWVLHLHGPLKTPLRNPLKGFTALVPLLLPVLFVCARRLQGNWAWAGGAAAVGLIYLIWETYNRAAVAGMIGGAFLVVLAMLLRGEHKRVIGGMLAAAVVSSGLVIYYLKSTRYIFEGVVPGSDWLFPVWLVDYERQTIWQHVWNIAMKAPWFGIGPNTINFTPGADQVIPGTLNLHLVPSHPHNWFFEIAAEVGFVGLAALLVTIGVSMAVYACKYKKTGNSGYLAAIAICGGYWGSGLFNFSYWSAWWQMSFFLALALAALCAKAPDAGAGRC
jgi:O-antigen ligase